MPAKKKATKKKATKKTAAKKKVAKKGTASSRGADPTEPLRVAAGAYAGVEAGKACTQTSFKTDTAFLYVGVAKGLYKAMFKLDASLPRAEALAAESPDRFEVGKNGWVTARFTAEEPLPPRLWKKWLDESVALSRK